jgi:hypothetical protein
LTAKKHQGILSALWKARNWRSSALQGTICVLAIVIFSFCILIIRPRPSEDDMRSLVSIIGEALTGAFSFVFTVSLFIISLARERMPEYEPWILRQAFGKFTIFYMAIFIISIILPFVTLIAGLEVFLVYISLILFFTCIVLLVPYFLNLNRVINLDPVVLLRREATRKIAEAHSPNRDLSFLSMMASNAFSTKNYFLFWRCTDVLLDLMLELVSVTGRPRKKLEVLTTSIETIEDLTDPLYYVTKELEQLCLATTREPRMSRKLMAMLLFKCRFISRESSHFLDFCSRIFFLIGEFAINQQLSYESERAAERLWILGAIAITREMPDTADRIIETLERYYGKYKPSEEISLSEHEKEWVLQESKNYRLDSQAISGFEERLRKRQMQKE